MTNPVGLFCWMVNSVKFYLLDSSLVDSTFQKCPTSRFKLNPRFQSLGLRIPRVNISGFRWSELLICNCGHVVDLTTSVVFYATCILTFVDALLTYLPFFQRSLDNMTSFHEMMIKSLFKFVQGAAHLWDMHEIGLARQERKLQARDSIIFCDQTDAPTPWGKNI